MKKIDFTNKKFFLVKNSENGEVDSETVFEYQQDGNLVTADYYGGAIKYGKIIAHLKDDTLIMMYQCITLEYELKAGKAIAKITFTKNNKIKLSLNWEWLHEKNKKGTSEYIQC